MATLFVRCEGAQRGDRDQTPLAWVVRNGLALPKRGLGPEDLKQAPAPVALAADEG